ncbi:MAG: hypothetical protein LBK59_04420, partial [Bifidobacteriaceae bacterium]|nr:hypothetical protein [Bifidobacteriaceae bacterium]
MKKVAVIGIALAVGLAACAVGFAAWRSGEPSGQCGEPTSHGGSQPWPRVDGLPDIPAGQGIFSTVVLEASSLRPGGQATANGTLTMPKERRGDVAISVSWVNPATSSVYARGVVTLEDVQPGERRGWDVATSLPPDAA